jgi:hypothetical protein
MELFLVIFVGFLFVICAWLASAQVRRGSRARDRYLEALEALKRDPSNADLRQTVLAFGRTHALLNKELGVSEVSLLNDINAATARASAPVAQGLPESAIESRLAKLRALASEGLIDQADFDRKKAEIISEI